MRKTLCILLLGLLPIRAREKSLDTELVRNRDELWLQDGHLAGPGAQILKEAISPAQLLLMREAHGTVEVPALMGGLFEVAAARGFGTLALETGPLTAAELDRWIRIEMVRPQWPSSKSYIHQYPFLFTASRRSSAF